MGKLIKNNLGNLIVMTVIAILAIGGLFYYSSIRTKGAEIQEIKIMPTDYSGSWSNQKAALVQDLGPDAYFDEFNGGNSTFPFGIFHETPHQSDVTSDGAGQAELASLSEEFNDISTPHQDESGGGQAPSDIEEQASPSEEIIVPETPASPSETSRLPFILGVILELPKVSELFGIEKLVASESPEIVEQEGNEQDVDISTVPDIEELATESEGIATSSEEIIDKDAIYVELVPLEELEMATESTESESEEMATSSEEIIDELISEETATASEEVTEEEIIEEPIEPVVDFAPGFVESRLVFSGFDVPESFITAEENLVTENEESGEEVATTSEEMGETPQLSNESEGQVATESEDLEEIATESEGFIEEETATESEDVEKKIKNVQLRMSLAFEGGGPQDSLIIEYSTDENWQYLAEFRTSDPNSNATNNGYWLYGLPIFENWEDLNNLEVRFTYRGILPNPMLPISETNQPLGSVYLDALWLEVEYEGPKAEEEVAETEEEEEEEEMTISEDIEVNLLSGKKDFKLDEKPKFEFKYSRKKGFFEKIAAVLLDLFRDEYKDIKIKAKIFGPNGKEIEYDDPEGFSPQIEYNGDGEFLVALSKPRHSYYFKPGKYKLRFEIEDPLTGSGQVFIQEQEFTWGVLAINVNKSIYISDKQQETRDKAYIQMAVLNDGGHTICDANLKLEIKEPRAGLFRGVRVVVLSTEDGTIEYSEECGPNNVIDVPDYFAYYEILNKIGIYEMKLTNLDNGYEITDSFEVRESVLFDVERIGPTRIYPPATYEMVIKIKANQDFTGEIVETVPMLFAVSEAEMTGFSSPEQEPNIGNYTKTLTWKDVEFKAGESYEIKYIFDAPDVSPYLYLLGPLKFYGKLGAVIKPTEPIEVILEPMPAESPEDIQAVTPNYEVVGGEEIATESQEELIEEELPVEEEVATESEELIIEELPASPSEEFYEVQPHKLPEAEDVEIPASPSETSRLPFILSALIKAPRVLDVFRGRGAVASVSEEGIATASEEDVGSPTSNIEEDLATESENEDVEVKPLHEEIEKHLVFEEERKWQIAADLTGATYLQTEACTTACTNATTNWSEAATIDIDTTGDGTTDWLVIANWEFQAADNADDVKLQIQLDNSTTYTNLYKAFATDGDAKEYPNEGTMFMLDDLSDGTHYIDLDFALNSTVGPARIRNIHIVALRIDDIFSAGDYEYAVDAASSDLTTSFVSQLSDSITPGSAGKYLFLMSAEGTAGNTGDGFMAYLDIAGTKYPVLNSDETNTHMGTEPIDALNYDSYLHGAVVNISGATTYQIYASVPNGTSGKIRNRRLFAMRLPTFGAENTGFFEAHNWAQLNEVASSPTVRTTLTFTPPEAGDYLIMAFGVSRADNFAGYAWQDLNYTAVGVMQKGGHDMKDVSNPGDSMPFSYAEILEDLPASTRTFQHRHWQEGTAGTSPCVVSSQILAIRLNIATTVISGDCRDPDQVSLCQDGQTVKVAVNGVVDPNDDDLTDGGSWSIARTPQLSQWDTVVVFIDGTTHVASRAVAVANEDDSNDTMGGMHLYESHLTIGSNDNITASNSDLGTYDYSIESDPDVFFEVGDATNDLKVCYSDGAPGCEDFKLYIKEGNTYEPDSGNSGNVDTHDIEIEGTFDLDNNVASVSGEWYNGNTFTAGGSTIFLTASQSEEGAAIEEKVSGSLNFYNLKFGDDTKAANATWKLQNALNINGNLEIDAGTLDMNGSNNINITGNLTINQNGNYTKGSGLITFVPPNTWTDYTSPKQDMGRISTSNDAGVVTLGSSVKASELLIQAADTLDIEGYTLTISGDGQGATNRPFIINSGGKFDVGANSTVSYIASQSTDIEDINYFNLELASDSANSKFYIMNDPAEIIVSGQFIVEKGNFFGGTDEVRIQGTDPTPFTVSGVFTPQTSTISYEGDANITVASMSDAGDSDGYYNLAVGDNIDLGAGRTYTLDGNTSVSWDLNIGAGSGDHTHNLFAGSHNLNLSNGGEPLIIRSKGYFDYDTSTVRYTAVADTTVNTGAHYYNLELGEDSQVKVTDWKEPGICENIDQAGNSGSWTNPGYASTTNDEWATWDSMVGGDYSDWLRCTNFDFDTDDISDGSTISGIEVEIERHMSSAAGWIQDYLIYLRKSTEQVGDNKGSGTTWPYSDGTATYGDSGDDWNSGLDDSDIRTSGFGVDISAWETLAEDAIAYIDRVRIRVHLENATFTAGSNIVVNNQLDLQSANTGNVNTFDIGSYDFTVGSASVTNSGGISVPIRSALTQTSSGTTIVRSEDGSIAPTIGGAGDTQFYNFTVGVASASDTNSYTFTLAGEVNASGDFTIEDGGSGTHELDLSTASISVWGDWDLSGSGASLSVSTGMVNFTGTGNTNFINDSAASASEFYNLTIKKTNAGTDDVTLYNANLPIRNTLTIDDGRLVQGNYDVRVEDVSAATNAVSVGSGAEWSDIGTGNLTLGGDFANAGSVSFDTSDNACAGGGTTDDISITSTVADTARDWSGGGSFYMYNLTIEDQDDTSIVCYSCTEVDESSNWDFKDCPSDIYQKHYRWRDDSQDLNTGGGLADKDTHYGSLDPGDAVRLRVLLDNDGGAASNYEYTLVFSQDTDNDKDCSDETTFAAVTSTSSNFQVTGSDQYLDNDTTNNGSFLLNDPAPGGTAVDGKGIAFPSNETVPFALGQNKYTEFEYIVSASASGLTASKNWCFQVTSNSESPGDEWWDVYPQIRIGAPHLKQAHYRWYYDEDSRNPLENQNTAHTNYDHKDNSFNTRVVFAVENVGEGSAASDSYRVEWSAMTGWGTCEAVPSTSYSAVPTSVECSSDVVCMVDSIHYADQATISAASKILDSPEPQGTFIEGHQMDTSNINNINNQIRIEEASYTEAEFNIKVTNQAAEGTTYCFRLTKDGDSFHADTNEYSSHYENVAALTTATYEQIDQQHFRWRYDNGYESSFGGDGVVLDDITEQEDIIYAIASDSEYLYIVGECQYCGGSGGSEWLIQKRRISDGQLDQNFGTEGVFIYSPSSSADKAYAVAVDGDYVYVAGYYAGVDEKWLIIKLNKFDGDGDPNFGGVGSNKGYIISNPTGDDDRIQSIIIEGDYMYIAGWQDGGGGDGVDSYAWHIEKRDITEGYLASDAAGGYFGNHTGSISSDPSSGDDYAYSITTDGSYIYVAGNCTGCGDEGGDAWHIEKRDINEGYLASAGSDFDAHAWGATGSISSDPSSEDDGVYSMIVDDSYIYTTGYCASCGDGGSSAWHMEKRDATEGYLVSTSGEFAVDGWGTTGSISSDPSMSGEDDHARSITTDGSYIYIAGHCNDCGDEGGDAWHIEKRNITNGILDSDFGTNGSITVDPSFDPAGGTAQAHGIVTDGSCIYTAGFQRGGGPIDAWANGRWDNYTIRLEKRLNSDGSLYTGAEWKAVLDTAITGVDKEEPIRLRFDINTASANATNYEFQLQVAPKGGGTCEAVVSAQYVDVAPAGTCAANNVACMKTSKYFTNQASTSQEMGTYDVIHDFSVDDDKAYAIASDSEYLYIAGYCDGCGNTGSWASVVEKRRISDGTLDPNFASSGVLIYDRTSNAEKNNSIAVDSDYIYIAGLDESDDWRIEKRSKITGEFDTNFDGDGWLNSGTAGEPYSIVEDGDYIYIAGYDVPVAGNGVWRIERRSKDNGEYDIGFDNDGYIIENITSASGEVARSLIVDSSSLYIVGYQLASSGDTAWRIEKRDKEDGSYDTGFDSDGYVISNPTEENKNDYAYSITDDSNYIYIVGSQDNDNEAWRIEKRKKSDGSYETSFDDDGYVINDISNWRDDARGITIDDNYIYVVGRQYVGTEWDWRIEKRDKTTGAYDTGFDSDGYVIEDPGGVDDVYGIVTDGTYIYVAGYCEDCGPMGSGGEDAFRIEKRDANTGRIDNWQEGQIVEDPLNITTAYDTASGSFSEVEFNFEMAPNAAKNTAYCFRVTNNGEPLNNYSKVAELGVAGPTSQPSAVNTDQTHYWWRNDDGIESAFASAGYVVSDLTTGSDYAYAIASDSEHIYTAGTCYQCGSNDSYAWVIEKRSIIDGQLDQGWASEGVVISDPTAGVDIAYSITVNSSYIYITGTQNEVDWRIEKRYKSGDNAGDDVDSFGTGGYVISNPGATDHARSIIVEGNYIYTAGYCQNCGDEGGAAWMIQKRDITDGSLVTTGSDAWGTTGSISSDPTSGNDFAYSITSDGFYIYIAGCENGSTAWHIEKRSITDGSLDSNFGSSGSVSSNPSSGGDCAYSITSDGSYIYTAGYYNEGAGDNAWMIQKRNITEGDIASVGNEAWGSTGSVSSDPSSGIDHPYSIITDGSYIYTAGYYYDGINFVDAWHIEKRDITEGDLASVGAEAWGNTGSISVDPALTDSQAQAIVTDDSYIYVAGYQGGSEGPLGSDAWRVEKRFLSNGELASNSATYKTIEPDTAITNVTKDTDLRLRFQVNVASASDYFNYQLQVAPKGGNTCEYLAENTPGVFDNVPTSDLASCSNGVGLACMTTSTYFDNRATTSQEMGPWYQVSDLGKSTGATGDYAYAIASDSEYVYIAGSWYDGNDNQWQIEKRSKFDGELDPNFGNEGVVLSDPGTDDVAQAIAVASESIFIAGYENGVDWRIEKRNKSDGSYDTDFGGDGSITSNPGGTDKAQAIIVDGSYIYVAGYCKYCGDTGNEAWMVQKRDTLEGDLASQGTDFGSGGSVSSDPSSYEDYAYSITADDAYIYIAGYDGKGIAGDDEVGRIEKRSKTDGSYDDDFDDDGYTETGTADDKVYSITIDESYLYVASDYAVGPSDEGWDIKKIDKDYASVSWTRQVNPTADFDIPYSITTDGSYIYIAGYKGGANEQMRIEKRSKSEGDLASGSHDEFGVGGVVTVDPSGDEDIFRGIVTDGDYIYVAGYQDDGGGQPLGGYAWRVEKRDANTGRIDNWQEGQIVEDTSNITSAIDMASGSFSEVEFQFKLTDAAADATSYCFRVVDDGENLTTYSKVAELQTEVLPVVEQLHYWWRNDDGYEADFGGDGHVVSDYTTSYDYAYAIASDSEYVYIAGICKGNNCDGGTGESWVIEKRSILDGQLDQNFGNEGVKISNPTTDGNDRAQAIVVEGNYIYVAGYENNVDWRIEKINKTTGAYDTDFGGDGSITSDPGSTDKAQTIIVEGNYIYTAGSCKYCGDTGNAAWMVQKRDLAEGDLASIGAEAWGSTGSISSDLSGGDDIAYSITTDGSYIYIAGLCQWCGDQGDYAWIIQKRDIIEGDLASDSAGGYFGNHTGMVVSDPSDNDIAYSITTDGSYIYIAGQCENCGDEGSYAWMVQKRDLTGDLASDSAGGYFGNHTGSISSDPSSGSDTAGSITTDGSYIYIAGWCTGCGDEGGGAWMIQKRDITEGDLASTGANAWGTTGSISSDPSDGTDHPGDGYGETIVTDGTYIYIAGYQDGGGALDDGSSYAWRVEKRLNSSGALFDGASWETTDIDTSTTSTKGDNIRLRFDINVASTSADDYQYQLQWAPIGGGTCEAVASDQYEDVPNSTDYTNEIARMKTSIYFSDQASTSQEMGPYYLVSDLTKNSDQAYAIASDSEYVYIAGYCDGCGSEGGYAWQIEKRRKSDGTLDSNFGNEGVVISDPSSGVDIAQAIAVEGDYIYAAGYENNIDWRIEKINKSDGSYDTGFGGDGSITSNPGITDNAQAIIVEGSYIYVVGYCQNCGDEGGTAWHIEKRDITEGDLASDSAGGYFGNHTGSISSDPTSGSDTAHSITIDGSYIYVAGDCNGCGDTGGSAWMIQKRDLTGDIASTGAEAWGNTGSISSDPTSGSDYPYSIITDGSYIYTAGFCYKCGDEDGYAWMVQKRDITEGDLASVGAEAWGNTGSISSDPTSGTDWAYSITIDGNYIYTAGHQTDSGDEKWRIEKRSKTDGDLASGSHDEFGVGGVVTSNPTDDNDKIERNSIVTDGKYIYAAGYQNGSGQLGGYAWRLEKRDINTGRIDTFQDGHIVENLSNLTSGFNTASGSFNEIEFNFELTTYATDDLTYCFRVTNNGTPLDSYAKVAPVTATTANVPPTIHVANVYGADMNDNIILIENTAIDLMATITINDDDGCDDIQEGNVEAWFLTSDIWWNHTTGTDGSTCSYDENNCYDNTVVSCSFASCAGNVATYQCVASSAWQYFADSTEKNSQASKSDDEWIVIVYASDSAGNDVTSDSWLASDSANVNLFSAIDVEQGASDSIPYGAVMPGSVSSTKLLGIRNTGNRGVDPIIEEYGSMSLNGEDTEINTARQQYATFDFTITEAGTSLSGDNLAYALDLTLPQRGSGDDDYTSISDDQLYWGIDIPYDQTEGDYKGSVSYTSTPD